MSAHDQFLALVDALRKRGAVRVRDGSLEVAFTSPDVAPPSDKPYEREGIVATGEQAELAELRAMRERMQEFG